MQDILEVFRQGQAQRQAADRSLMAELIHHLKNARTTPVEVPAHSSLGCWLRLYQQTLDRPNVRTRLPLDLASLGVERDATQLKLPAQQVLNFYGYPHPRHRGQRMVIAQALDQLDTFAHPRSGLNDQLKRLDQDLRQIADRLEGLIDDEDFSLYSSYKTYFKLDSGSFWATHQQTGAALLDTLTTTPAFLALGLVQGLQPGAYTFDPATRRLSGKNAWGTLVDIGVEHLVKLPEEAGLSSLISVAEQLGTFVHQSGLFSLAQLLRCHDLPVPDTPEEARTLVNTLRQSTPLAILPVNDLADSDLALMQHLQWLAMDQDRDIMAVGLAGLIDGQPSDALIDTASVELTPARNSSVLHPGVMRHPAITAGPACGPFTLEQLLQHHQFDPPDTAGDAQDTLQSLRMNLPRRSLYGDYHALLSTTAPSPVRLNTEARETIVQRVNHGQPENAPRLLDRLCGTLLNDKSTDEVRRQADALLSHLLSLEPARRLGQQLIEALHWYGQHPDESASQTSLGLLVLSALILDLDPGAGNGGYTLAGFNLAADTHWGHSPVDLRRDLELHLVRTCKVSSAAAPLAAHLLLAGVAPEFLVQALPMTLRYRTSITWMTFRQGVMMAQALAPGSTQHMTYDDMIALASQPPATLQQQQWRDYTATSTLLDWAIAQGELPERENGHYLVDEITALKRRLTQRLQALKDALITFASELPTRRGIALADLEKVFPGQPMLDTACLWRPVAPIAGSSLRFPMHHHDRSNYSLHSLLELHLDGLLDDTRWQSINPEVDLAKLRQSFGRLGDINQRFDDAFGAYIERMKEAYSATIEDLLAQLPLADRLHLQQADLQLLILKKEPGKDLVLLSPEQEIARIGRMGVILRGTSPTTVCEYELFPLLNRALKRRGPPLVFNEGGTPIPVTTGGAHSTRPITTLMQGNELPLDWEAYATGRQPRPGVRSKVIVHTLWSRRSTPADPLVLAPLTYGSTVNRAIAQAIVQQHFFLEVDALRRQARGSTQREHIQQRWDRVLDRLKSLVPFWSCSQDIASRDTRRMIDGSYACFIDLLTMLFPTQRYLKASLAVLKRTMPLPIKLLQLGRLSTAFLHSVLNPLDGLPGLYRLARNGLIQLSVDARRILDTAIGQVQRLVADIPLLDHLKLLARADIGSGSLLHTSDLVRLNAILHKNRWHACHPFSAKPYGPAVDNFRLDSALGVTPMHTSNGYEALVTDRLFGTQPLLIPRSDATDLLHGNTVRRLDHRAPTHLDDLASPAYFKAADGFDSTCAATRTKRSPIPLICFTKKLAAFNSSIHQRRAQAIEHIRLIPAPAVGPDKRKLVYNRRLYEATPQVLDFEMTPVAMNAPLAYKAQVNGRLIENEPQFGLPINQVDNLLTRDTRVVELEGLVDAVDDRRTLRALVIDLNPPGAAPRSRTVVEADAGVFYDVIAIDPAPSLRLDRLDFSLGGVHEQLIRAYCKRKLDYLSAGGFIQSRPLVNLPTLEVLYSQLSKRNFTPEKIALLRAQASQLRVIKQRELLLNASDEGRRLGMSVAVEPIRLQTWAPYAPQSGHTLNQYLATQAHTHTVALLQSTGIGPSNVVGVGAGEMARLDIAESVVMWQYSRVGQPNFTEVILRTGAGNCDQMAHVATELIRLNGGAARVWGMTPPAHAFVVVGTPPPTLAPTVDFSEAAWTDLWICDPWAGIVSPARDYMAQLTIKMHTWYLQDMSIFFNDRGTYRWVQAHDRGWLTLLRTALKRPQT
ncbi:MULTISPECIES: hypothetical protein [unclassified Pseudomonas]|jgi:hypothetical protein|uniref:Uncharacterized protein n=1 Tax=Pseudomonas gorinensis TaxID=3240790 RepID=A0ACA7P246_9PSED|nr:MULTISPECIES: hypothetical protein [unclassified Pseudomonas]AHC33882.1 hypothetical protein U771_06675 [Pseudomonas sp. TKP]MBL1307691.1 hypothetical protein [Pseudomonas sp.]PMX13924.1 hypothetical protein C1Y25_16840 [Pseudomonas sp. MPBC4-3]PMX47034.1 hypothetical protein C1Y20_14855 [Pseudomonas sp. FW301-21B01]PMY07759.1 hypothetical protein C1Y18_12170 [Pseudomonas sp. MPR-R5A]